MNWPEVFLHMKAGSSLDEAHQKAVEAALKKYPFFALGRMMAAKIATKLGDPRAQGLRFLASLYAPSRQYYAFFLEERLRPRVPPPPRLTTPPSSGRESHTPSSSAASKKEEPSSSDDPGAEGMALSPAFWPPLQGWVRARMRLYARWGERLREQLICPRLPLLPSKESPIPSEPPETPAKPLSAPHEPPASVLETPLEKEVSSSTEATPSPPDRTTAEDPASLSEAPPSVSPAGPDLPLQASDLPIPPIKRSEESASEKEETPPPPSVRLGSFHIQFELPLKSSPPRSALADRPSPMMEETSASSGLSRSYVPLEEVEAPVHLPVPEPEHATPEGPLSTPSLRGTFVPLENPEARIHLEPSPSSSEELYSSDSPIRSFVPLDIDVKASIHLPVPEPSESPEAPFSFVGPSSEEEKIEQTGETDRGQPPSLLQKGWQSFLEELQQMSLPPEKPLTARSELENLKREYIRRLLEKRIIQPITPPSPKSNNLIDQILEKLESFPKKPPSQEVTVELSVPTWEPAPKAPRIYTETMARLYWSQGDLARAVEVYEALCQRYPEKADHYRQQIERIRSGESPT